MSTRTAKTGYWLVTVYWLGTAANLVAGAAMLYWLATKLVGSMDLGLRIDARAWRDELRGDSDQAPGPRAGPSRGILGRIAAV